MKLHPTSGALLSTLELVKGGLFGGVYAYVDNLNNLVVADGVSFLYEHFIFWLGLIRFLQRIRIFIE